MADLKPQGKIGEGGAASFNEATVQEPSPRLSEFAADGFRVHLTCLAVGCGYGGRTYDAADILAQHGDITLDELRRRAICGNGHRGRILVEVSSPPDGKGGFSGRGHGGT